MSYYNPKVHNNKDTSNTMEQSVHRMAHSYLDLDENLIVLDVSMMASYP